MASLPRLEALINGHTRGLPSQPSQPLSYPIRLYPYCASAFLHTFPSFPSLPSFPSSYYLPVFPVLPNLPDLQ